jgi:predicted component of type VI protein secretion system
MNQQDSSFDVSLRVADGVHAGREIPVRGTFLIGRAAGCNLRPASELVADHHCAIEIRREGPVLVDLGSEAGTFLNDDRLLLECDLRDGDILQVGPLRFVVQIAERTIELEPEDTDQVELIPRQPGPSTP